MIPGVSAGSQEAAAFSEPLRAPAERKVEQDLALVVPTVGRPILRRCLESVLAGDAWPGEIIVVDQSRSAALAGWLAEIGAPGIKTVHVPCTGTGRALGLNLGLRTVTARFVAITDDDCEVDPAWVARLAACLREHPGRVYTGRVLAAGEERVLNTVSDERPVVTRRPGLGYDRLSGGNCGMAIAILRRVGLFDEDPCMRYAEDGEWAYRALRAGVEIAYTPSLVVSHLGWRDLGQRLEQYRRYARSHAAFFGKYLRQGDARILLRAMVHWARALKRWARGVLSGDGELAANGRSYATELLPGIRDGLRSGRRPPTLE